MTNAQAFDKAFRPTDDQIDRLARLMGRFNTAQHHAMWPVHAAADHGEPVRFLAPLYATVDGAAVTDYDCTVCGGNIDARANPCRHQMMMLEAAETWVEQMYQEEDAADLRETRAL